MRQSLTNLLDASLYFTVPAHFPVRSSLQLLSTGDRLNVILAPHSFCHHYPPCTEHSKPHTTGRLEAGFYTEVTHRVDHQPAAAGHQSDRSPISDGCGEVDVTRTARYTVTPDTGNDPRALSRAGWVGRQESLAAW